MGGAPPVSIVDDASLRRSPANLIRSLGFAVDGVASVDAFVA